MAAVLEIFDFEICLLLLLEISLLKKSVEYDDFVVPILKYSYLENRII